MINTKHYYVIGDIHGQVSPIEAFVNNHPELYQRNKSENILVLLGDSGLNYYMDARDDKFKKALSEFPLTYFVIRGNHDERVTNVMAEAPKSEWYMSIAFGNRVFIQSKYPYIKYAEDRALVYKFYDKNVLVIPGAYSVDKYYRMMRGWRWFPGEQMTSWEMEDCENDVLNEQLNWKCDIVLSHTCPYHFEPTDLFIQGIDQNQVDKTMERFLGQIERKLDYKLWLWGHYHAFRHYDLTDRDAFMLDAGSTVFDLNQYFETGEDFLV